MKQLWNSITKISSRAIYKHKPPNIFTSSVCFTFSSHVSINPFHTTTNKLLSNKETFKASLFLYFLKDTQNCISSVFPALCVPCSRDFGDFSPGIPGPQSPKHKYIPILLSPNHSPSLTETKSHTGTFQSLKIQAQKPKEGDYISPKLFISCCPTVLL